VALQVYKSALASLHPSTSDTVSLYLGLARLAALPGKCSRHNAPARPHALTTIVKSTSSGVSETIIVVCEFDDVFASAAAVARAYPLYSKKTNAEATVDVEFLVVGGRGGSSISWEALDALATAVRSTARIVDMPCSEMNVAHFLEEVISVGETYGLDVTIVRGEELHERGLNGIYGVGRAAEVGPALAVLSTRPAANDAGGPVIAWVGKGIVYDTGGLSIKGKVMMPGMKRDCGGAAAVLGAMCVASRLGFSTQLHAVFCLAENSVGPRGTRPDDIHTLYSGRTVEINNTDAEGRLVLADGVVYAARDLKADVILDMATLTGAQAIATGKYHSSLLTNSATWERMAMACGKMSGDLVFPVPFCPELHFCEFNSAIADMKNSVGDRANAQSSCAGLFVLAHLGFDFSGSWIHVDMAAPVYSVSVPRPYSPILLYEDCIFCPPYWQRYIYHKV
ncbi:hypothetical protein AAG570_007126, partial [Ranatra chinensis]